MKIPCGILALVLLIGGFGCRPFADVREAETKAQALVAGRATTNEVIEAFGAAPVNIYSRADALRYLQQQPSSKQWKTMSQHSFAHEYSMKRPGGWALIYFDGESRAVSYYINIQ